MAYLSGMYGYGYGSQKIWSANEAPGIWSGDLRSSFYDGYDIMTVHEMDLSWMDSLKLPAAVQMGYMKDFFASMEWWKLIPTHGSALDFSKTGAADYVMARNGTEFAVLYFLNQTLDTGRVNLLEDCTYRVSWLNPRTGEKTISKKIWAEGENSNWIISRIHLIGWCCWRKLLDVKSVDFACPVCYHTSCAALKRFKIRVHRYPKISLDILCIRYL